MSGKLSKDTEVKIEEAIRSGMTSPEIRNQFGVGGYAIDRIRKGLVKSTEQRKVFKVTGDKAKLTLVTRMHFKNVDEILDYSQVDRNIWEPYQHILNSWDTTVKEKGVVGKLIEEKAHTYTNWQIKVWLRRKHPALAAAEKLLEDLKEQSPVIAKRKSFIPKNNKIHRELELCIFDPHLGLECFQPGADHDWDSEKCVNAVMLVIDKLLEMSKSYRPFERIIMPLGNDLLHCDNVFATTTAGTHQPEAKAWQKIYLEAEKLAIDMVKRVSESAPVKVIIVPGNHARQSEFTLGRLLNAYFHNNKNIEVIADQSPYKFHRYGVNLIGYEHGHSVRQQVRLAALMANECREDWNETVYREWHLGDQHRKGSAKPSMLEEQGVSVEYMPGMVVPNEWHRLKSYNWQKRGAFAFVWDKTAGPIARLQVNIDSYTGKVMV